MDFFAKRKYGTEGHLEVLESPGDAHYGDAEDEAAHKVDNGYLPPATEHPDEVHHHRHAARLIGPVNQFVAKWPEGVGPQLEKLHAEGYADDGYAHQQADDVVYHGDDDATKDKPEDVADEFHNYRTDAGQPLDKYQQL